MSFLSWLFIFFIVAFIGLEVLHRRASNNWTLFDPLNLFWIGILEVCVFQPAVYHRTYLLWHPERVFDLTLGSTLVGVLAVILGYYLRVGRTIGRNAPDPPERLNPARLAMASLGFIVAGGIGYVFWFESAGGFSQWVLTPRGGTNWDEVTGYTGLLPTLMPIGILTALIAAAEQPLFLRSAALAMALGQILWFAYLGTRGQSIMFIVAVTAVVCWWLRKEPPAVLVILGIPVLFLYGVFLGEYRGSFTNLSFNLDATDAENVFLRILPSAENDHHVRGSEFNCVLTTVDLVPDTVPYNYGYPLLEFVTRIIPRKLWPEKRYPFYEAATPLFFLGGLSNHQVPYAHEFILSGPAFSFVGHWYAMGGPLVVIAGGVVTGILLRAIAEFFRKNPRSGPRLMIYLVLLPIGWGEAKTTPWFWLFSIPLILPVVFFLLHLCSAGADPVVQRRASYRTLGALKR
jgi:hypothetical protein